MTRILPVAALALMTVAGAASAMTNAAYNYEGYISSEQAATLDAATLAAVKAAIHSGDNRSDIQGLVDSIVRK